LLRKNVNGAFSTPREFANNAHKPWKSGNATFSETTDRAGTRTDSPDLGPAFEFLEKTPGDYPGLSRVHCFCYPATLSHGAISGDIPAISAGARRFAQGIAARLDRDDVAQHYAAIEAYSEPKLQGDEWMPADPPPIRFSAMKGWRDANRRMRNSRRSTRLPVS